MGLGDWTMRDVCGLGYVYVYVYVYGMELTGKAVIEY